MTCVVNPGIPNRPFSSLSLGNRFEAENKCQGRMNMASSTKLPIAYFNTSRALSSDTD